MFKKVGAKQIAKVYYSEESEYDRFISVEPFTSYVDIQIKILDKTPIDFEV